MKKLQANVSYSLIHAGMWGLYAVILGFATNFLRKQGLQDSVISILLGTAAAVSCVLQVAVGELVSRIRKLKLYIVLLVVSGLLLAALAAMMGSNQVLAIIGMVVVCALLQAVPAMGNSIGMDAIAKGAPATYSVARGIGSLIYALSAQVTGTLISNFGEISIPALSAALTVVLAIGVIWFHSCAEKGLAETEVQNKEEEKKKDNFLRSNPRFALFLVGATLLCMSHFLVCTFMEMIIETKGGGAEEQGTATAISAFVELPIMFGFAFLVKKIRCHQLLRIAAVMFLAKTLGLFFATDPIGVYAAQATQMVGYGLYAIASVTYAGQVLGAKEAVRAQSYLAATVSAGSVVAMSIGGVLCQEFGVPVMLLVATGCALAGALIVVFSAQKAKN